MPEIVQLTELQIAIMRELWTRGEATVAELHEALLPERGLALTTIATVLSRLEKRGVVSHHNRSRQFVYRAELSEDEVRGSMLSDLTDRVFGGDVAALLTHLLSEREMSPGDLARVRELIEAHEAKAAEADDDR
jgi:BlaI family penicillinase repressor